MVSQDFEWSVDAIGVHAAHCCTRHGCRYSGLSTMPCPVESGSIKQKATCKTCSVDIEPHLETIETVAFLLRAVAVGLRSWTSSDLPDSLDDWAARLSNAVTAIRKCEER